MELKIKFGDKVKLVKPGGRTMKKHPSLLPGEEGAVVHIGYGYDYDVLVSGVGKMAWGGYGGIDWADELYYGIEWKNFITNGYKLPGLCERRPR